MQFNVLAHLVNYYPFQQAAGSKWVQDYVTHKVMQLLFFLLQCFFLERLEPTFLCWLRFFWVTFLRIRVQCNVGYPGCNSIRDSERISGIFSGYVLSRVLLMQNSEKDRNPILTKLLPHFFLGLGQYSEKRNRHIAAHDISGFACLRFFSFRFGFSLFFWRGFRGLCFFAFCRRLFFWVFLWVFFFLGFLFFSTCNVQMVTTVKAQFYNRPV